jgi:SAM-dependent methyltransferase
VTEWFEQWFGEEYLRLYRHRDEEDASAAVSLLAAMVPVDQRRVLDLACGPGRHAKLIRAAGGRVVGFDLSMPLLSRARHRAMPPLTVVRGDMRLLPFAPAAFDIVVNLFTSFGYFADDDQHRTVLRETTGVLNRGGRLVLDYFNSERLLASLVKHEEREIGRQRVIIERRLSEDARFVIKEMHLMDDGRHFMERVRLFSPEELEALVTETGLVMEHSFGDYDGSPLARSSPRAIIFAKKS